MGPSAVASPSCGARKPHPTCLTQVQSTPDRIMAPHIGDVHVHHGPAVVGDEEKDVERPEPERVHREEVRRPDLGSVVREERAPARQGVARDVVGPKNPVRTGRMEFCAPTTRCTRSATARIRTVRSSPEVGPRTFRRYSSGRVRVEDHACVRLEDRPGEPEVVPGQHLLELCAREWAAYRSPQHVPL